MPKEVEIEFIDGSKVTVVYPTHEEIEAEWDKLAPRLAALGLLDPLPMEEERMNHLFGIGNGDCEYCGAKPWMREQPCVGDEEE